MMTAFSDAKHKLPDWGAPEAPAPGLSARLQGWWIGTRGSRLLRSLKARRLRDDEEPRLTNIAGGLSADLGCPPPELWLVAEGGPNALVCRRGRHLALAVTRALLDRYTRTELEAVVAHSLTRSVAGRDRTSGATTEDDIRAAALTRYPPAMASAIAKAEPATGANASLWFVATAPTSPTVNERIEALEDL